MFTESWKLECRLQPAYLPIEKRINQKVELMYRWRHMTPEERQDALDERRVNRRPWHSPPHYHSEFTNRYLFTAACLNHRSYIGHSRQRLTDFEGKLLEAAEASTDSIVAWVILPNHYHFLGIAPNALDTLAELGRLHGRTSYLWNGEENQRGRQVWHNAAETAMKSDGHFWATINYIHHNPVKHGHVKCWQDWPWSSAHSYLDEVGREKAEGIWRKYPIDDYGKGWDD